MKEIKGRRRHDEVIAKSPPISQWPTVIASDLPEYVREQFERRRMAVEMYFAGMLLKDIQAKTGIQGSSVRWFVDRCLLNAGDGRMYGFRALIPGLHIKEYERTAPVTGKLPHAHGGYSGALMAVFDRFPNLPEMLKDVVLKRHKFSHVYEKKITAGTLHHLFLSCLEELGVKKTEWPFNTRFLGQRSIVKFMKKVLDAHFERGVEARENSTARAHLAVGTGKAGFIKFEEPLDAVEVDAYHIDQFMTVVLTGKSGEEVELVLNRLWLLALVDVVSTAVLSYYVVYRTEVRADDVLTLLRTTIGRPWEPMNLTISGLRYPSDGGLPSGKIPEFKGALWSALLVDGALVNLANSVSERARREIGCMVNWGLPGHFERRPNVERTFGEIARKVFHRMPSTTGSSPGRGRSDDAEGQAIRYRIRAEEAHEQIDVFFANHNATPSEGLSFVAPLEYLQQTLNARGSHYLVRLPPYGVEGMNSPLACIIRPTVRGGPKSGRRPHVTIDRVRYTSPILARAAWLVGVQLKVVIDEDDMRQVRAFLPNGAELGFLRAHGKWGVTKHSRSTRKAINSLIAKRLLVVTGQSDPVVEYLKQLGANLKGNSGRDDRRIATELGRVGRESGLPLVLEKDEEKSGSAQTQDDPLQKLKLHPMPDFRKLLYRGK